MLNPLKSKQKLFRIIMKVLKLKKETITTLNEEAMNQVHGGGGDLPTEAGGCLTNQTSACKPYYRTRVEWCNTSLTNCNPNYTVGCPPVTDPEPV